MKVQDLKEIVKHCVKTLQDVKKVDLKIAKYDLQKTRPSAKLCDSVDFTFVYKKPALSKSIFFKMHFDLWVHLKTDDMKLEYSKMVLETMWEEIKEQEKKLLADFSKNKQQSGTFKPFTLNGLGTYKPMQRTMKVGKVPSNHKALSLGSGMYADETDGTIYIDTEKMEWDDKGLKLSEPDYINTDIDLTGYYTQQQVKQKIQQGYNGYKRELLGKWEEADFDLETDAFDF